MIIIDKKKFAYIHIPKVAGTVIRELLSEHADENINRGIIKKHPDLGFMDYNHIPIFVLKDYFPTEFNELSKYKIFSMMRDPSNRFPSSVAQYISMYEGIPIENARLIDYKNATDKCIKYLKNYIDKQHYLGAKHIHFQPQYDYLFYDNKRFVDVLLKIQDIEEMVDKISAYLNIRLSAPENKNQTKEYKNSFFKNLLSTNDNVTNYFKIILPANIKDYLRPIIYRGSVNRFDDVAKSEYVKDFVGEYYKKDIALYETL